MTCSHKFLATNPPSHWHQKTWFHLQYTVLASYFNFIQKENDPSEAEAKACLFSILNYILMEHVTLAIKSIRSLSILIVKISSNCYPLAKKKTLLNGSVTIHLGSPQRPTWFWAQSHVTRKVLEYSYVGQRKSSPTAQIEFHSGSFTSATTQGIWYLKTTQQPYQSPNSIFLSFGVSYPKTPTKPTFNLQPSTFNLQVSLHCKYSSSLLFTLLARILLILFKSWRLALLCCSFELWICFWVLVLLCVAFGCCNSSW